MIARYGGLRKATIIVREDGKLDVIRERETTGESFRGLANLDEAFETIRAHGPRPAEPPSLRAVVGHYLHALDSEDEQILPDLIEELRALVWSPGAAPIPPRQTQVHGTGQVSRTTEE